MCEAFPLAQIWWKTGPYGDLMTQIEILDGLARQAGRMALWTSALERRRLRRFADEVLAQGATLESESEDRLRARVAELRVTLPRAGLTQPLTALAFALVREIRRRFIADHTYNNPGRVDAIFRLKQGSRVVGSARTPVTISGLLTGALGSGPRASLARP